MSAYKTRDSSRLEVPNPEKPQFPNFKKIQC